MLQGARSGNVMAAPSRVLSLARRKPSVRIVGELGFWLSAQPKR